MNQQDYIKQPRVTDADIRAYQKKKWKRPGSPAILPRLRGSMPRVGIHCSFMNSPTCHVQIMPALRKRDKSKAEIVGYAPDFLYSPCPEFDAQWYTGKMSDHQFCERVRADNIDILVELSGFSKGHRFGAMAMRAAPVQVSYLNHPASSHVPNVDYVFADREALPNWDTYSETPYFFDDCFFAFDETALMSPNVFDEPVTREGVITFGCFGSITKINPDLIKLWASVLNAVPRSRMVLLAEAYRKMRVQNKIAALFADEGIERRRLTILPGCSRFEVLANYRYVDVSLDTFPYCGGNTIAESFWMGAPVITLKGDRFASAYGASLVRAAGYPELIAHSPSDMCAIAKNLTSEWLRTERTQTREKGRTLFDPKRLARQLEKAWSDLLPLPAKPQVSRVGADDELGNRVPLQVVPPPPQTGAAEMD